MMVSVTLITNILDRKDCRQYGYLNQSTMFVLFGNSKKSAFAAGVVLGLFLFPTGGAIFNYMINTLSGKYTGLSGEQIADMLTSNYLQSRYFSASENIINSDFRLVLKSRTAQSPSILVSGDLNSGRIKSVGILDSASKQVDLYFNDGNIVRQNTSYNKDGQMLVVFDYGCSGIWDMMTNGNKLMVNDPSGILEGEIVNGKGTVTKSDQINQVIVKDNQIELLPKNHVVHPDNND